MIIRPFLVRNPYNSMGNFEPLPLGRGDFIIPYELLGCPWYLVNGLFHPYKGIGWIRPINR